MNSSIAKCVDRLGRWAYYLSAVLIVFIFVSVIIEVFARGLTNTSISWVAEISGYLLAGVLYLGLGYLYRRNWHVRMSLLLDILSPKYSRLLYWLTDFIVGVFAIVQFWEIFNLALESYQFNWRSSTILEVPLYLPQFLMAAGAFVFLLEVIRTALLRQLTSNDIGAEQ